jgi:hypothetical protein
MLGEDGENFVAIAQSLINAVGDTTSAYFEAQNRANSAQTPGEQSKWSEIAEVIKATNQQNQKPDYMPWIVGGGIGVLALVLLAGNRRR